MVKIKFGHQKALVNYPSAGSEENTRELVPGAYKVKPNKEKGFLNHQNVIKDEQVDSLKKALTLSIPQS